MNKQLLYKILDYWYMMDVLNQNEHPYEDVKNYTRMKQKAERRFNPAPPQNFVDISFSVTAEQLRGDVILKLVNDELRRLDRLRGIEEGDNRSYSLYGSVTLYLGEVGRENCLIQLAELLNSGTDLEARPEKMDSRLSLALMQIDENGNYVERSLSVSPVVWAISELKRAAVKRATCLTSKDYLDIITAFDKRFTETAAAVEEIWRTLSAALDYSNAAADREDSQEFIVKCAAVCSKKNIEAVPDTPRLSMSFYADDLAMCRRMIENGKLTDMTAGYIASAYNFEGIPPQAKDLVKGDSETIYSLFDRILDVKQMPKGKWPSEFFPALMQQAAIDLETDRENVGSIFSVNGPPGTGKTTLLKEIIVNNIVERASKIYDFTESVTGNDPDKLFEEVPFKHGDVRFRDKCGYSLYSYGWYRLKKEYDKINDYGIVVASCNNAAVENISKELPVDEFTSYCNKKENSKDQAYARNAELFSPVQSSDRMDIFAVKLDKGKLPAEFSNFKGKAVTSHRDVYFSYYADSLLNNDEAAAQLLEDYTGTKDPRIAHAWGLIAAPLGKRKNVKKFHESVLCPLVKSMQVFGKEKKNEAHEERLRAFRKARKEFKSQLDKVLEHRQKLEVLQNTERSRHEHEKNIAAAIKLLRQYDYPAIIRSLDEKAAGYRKKLTAYGDADSIKAQRIKHQGELLTFQKELSDTAAKQRMHENESKKKGLFGFGRKKAEDHFRQAEECRKRCEELETIIAGTKNLLTDLEDIGAVAEKLTQTEKKSADVRAEYTKLRQIASYAVTDWKRDDINVINSAFISDYLDKESDRCTTANTAEMRVDKEYDRQREKLFYYALQLNKHFVYSSNCLLENYKLLGQYWGLDKVQKSNGGKYEKVFFHRDDAAAFAPALFQSLLLLVPVISTTFASVGSMFRDVRKQDVFGTLIVDEAGQATPECAVGALIRSRRAMIVGDPKQVEPVVTDDLKLLRDSFDDDRLQIYKDPTLSVQTFADSLNPYGTVLSDTDEEGNPIDKWVGCPLVVHRRCISPMFEISNELSYKIMKNQTKEPNEQETAGYILKKSCWLDIGGSEVGSKNHYVREQGEKTAELIIESFRKSNKTPSIYVISPFTSVVRGMRNTIMSMVRETTDEESTELYDRIEQWSKTCIGTVHRFQGKEAKEVFFVLGCDKTSIPAVRWVNTNIVNVAATRAKHRLYIVGEYDGVWSCNPNLSTAHRLIEEHEKN